MKKAAIECDDSKAAAGNTIGVDVALFVFYIIFSRP